MHFQRYVFIQDRAVVRRVISGDAYNPRRRNKTRSARVNFSHCVTRKRLSHAILNAKKGESQRVQHDRRNAARFPFPLDLIRDSTTCGAHVGRLSSISRPIDRSIGRPTDRPTNETDAKTRSTMISAIRLSWLDCGDHRLLVSPKQRTLADNTRRPWLRSLLRSTIRI